MKSQFLLRPFLAMFLQLASMLAAANPVETNSPNAPYTVTVQARVLFGTDGRAQEVGVVDSESQPAAFVAAVKDRLAKARIQAPSDQGLPATLGTGVSMTLEVTPGAIGGQLRVLGLQMHPLALATRLVALPDDAFISGETERELLILCDIDLQGRCAQATVKGAPGMPESVRRWARLSTEAWRFEPQTLNGKPITGSYETRLRISTDPSLQPEDFRASKFNRATGGR